MKYIKKFEEIHYLNVDLVYSNIYGFEFIIDVKNASQRLINLAFEKFEEYTELDDRTKKYLVSTDNAGKAWAWRISLSKGFFGKQSISFGIITSPKWGIGDGDEVDDRVTIEEFLKVGLEGVIEYIKSGNTYFKILSELGCDPINITPEEFFEIGLDNVKIKEFCLNDIKMRKNANKFKI